jgi:hypothetical protein
MTVAYKISLKAAVVSDSAETMAESIAAVAEHLDDQDQLSQETRARWPGFCAPTSPLPDRHRLRVRPQPASSPIIVRFHHVRKTLDNPIDGLDAPYCRMNRLTVLSLMP